MIIPQSTPTVNPSDALGALPLSIPLAVDPNTNGNGAPHTAPSAPPTNGATAPDRAAAAPDQPPTYDRLISEIDKIDGRAALMSWLLDNAERFADLDPMQLEKIAIHLNQTHRIAQTWIYRIWAKFVARASQSSRSTLSAILSRALADLGYSFSLNECNRQILLDGNPLDDETEAEIRAKMRDLGHTVAAEVEDIIKTLAKQNIFHPVKRYLESLIWDGEDHILNLSKHLKDTDDLIAYPETDTARHVIHVWLRRWLVGAIAKTYGVGQNAMLVLNGAQNAGKSSFAKWLASPIPGMHCEEPIDPDSPIHNRLLASRWVWESAELASTTGRADVNALKAFLTKTECSFKIPYAKQLTTRPALASFIGSVNPDNLGYLVDDTGNRRYMSVNLESIDWAYRQNVDVNQVWAQAYALFRQGEPWQLAPNEAKRRDELNREHQRGDLVDDWIDKYFVVDPTKDDWRMTAADIAHVLRVYGGAKDSDRELSTKIGIALGRFGVRRNMTSRPRCYVGIKQRDPMPTNQR